MHLIAVLANCRQIGPVIIYHKLYEPRLATITYRIHDIIHDYIYSQLVGKLQQVIKVLLISVFIVCHFHQSVNDDFKGVDDPTVEENTLTSDRLAEMEILSPVSGLDLVLLNHPVFDKDAKSDVRRFLVKFHHFLQAFQKGRE